MHAAESRKSSHYRCRTCRFIRRLGPGNDGYQVTIFEALPVAGGMLAVAIPEYRLPKDILQKEIDEIKDLGVEIKLNTPVKDAGALLKDGYKAVFIAPGLSRASSSVSWGGISRRL